MGPILRFANLLTLGLGLLLAWPALAQRQPANPDQDEDNYTKASTFGVTTNTNASVIGGISYRYETLLPGTLLGKRQFQYWSLEIVNVRHPRELQVTYYNGSRVTEDKMNYLLVLRPQYGRQINLFQRNGDDGITINAILAGGPSIGIIKPYYLDVLDGTSQTRTRSVSYATAKATNASVVGGGNFFSGFSESSLTVGLHLKAALSFELSAFRNNTTGVEIGGLAEIYPKVVPIMDTAPNRAFYTSAYITLFFGTKK